MNTINTCQCVICGFCGSWENTDDIHGNLWSCDVCGEIFCEKCFIEKFGANDYNFMLKSGEYIRCPECYEKIISSRERV